MLVFVKLSPRKYLVGHTSTHQGWRSTGQVDQGYKFSDLTIIHGPDTFDACHTAASQWAIAHKVTLTHQEYKLSE